MHQQDGHAVPVHADPGRRAAARLGVRHGLASGRRDARPDARARSAPRRGRRGRPVALGALCWLLHIVTAEGADPWLFRGGFLFTGLATLAVIAAVTHRRAAMGTLLGNPVFVWIGTRSYGLYLYHWPIFQGIRRVAGNVLSLPEFIVGMIASGIVAELSYRYIETPVRKGALGRAWTRLRHGGSSDTTRRTIAVGAAALVVRASASPGPAWPRRRTSRTTSSGPARKAPSSPATRSPRRRRSPGRRPRRRRPPSRRRPWRPPRRRRSAARRPRCPGTPPVSPAPTAAPTAVATTGAPATGDRRSTPTSTSAS